MEYLPDKMKKTTKNIGCTDKVRNGRPACKEKAIEFSQYFPGSTEVLQGKYYSTFKEVLQSSAGSTEKVEAIAYQHFHYPLKTCHSN